MTADRPGLRLVKLRNPWGNEKEWNGAWSDGSSEWTSYPMVAQVVDYKASADGIFWMAFDDFARIFEWAMVHKKTMRGGPGFVNRQRWAADNAQGSSAAAPTAVVARPQRQASADDEELQRALALSAADEEERQRQRQRRFADETTTTESSGDYDADLAKALALSRSDY